MSRRNNIRAACAVLLMLLLPAAGAMGVRYATSAVTRGSFKRTAVVNGAILRLETQTVAAQAHGARLGNVYVAVGDAVAPGDLLASYVLPVSATAVKRAEIAWRTAVEDAAYEKNAHQARIAELRASLETETDETAAEILSLQIKRAEITHARADADAAAQIAALEAAYEDARTADEEQPLYASISGVVDSVVNLEPGASIDASRAIVTLHNPEKVLIRAENASGALQYGMAVDVRLTGYTGQSTTAGVVVAADNVLPGEARSGYAYIAYEAPARGDFHSATVTAVTMRAEDALIAPARAISLRDGLCTVTILDADGTLRTRHVVKAMDDGAQAWLWMGVDEGDKLITK